MQKFLWLTIISIYPRDRMWDFPSVVKVGRLEQDSDLGGSSGGVRAGDSHICAAQKAAYKTREQSCWNDNNFLLENANIFNLSLLQRDFSLLCWRTRKENILDCKDYLSFQQAGHRLGLAGITKQPLLFMSFLLDFYGKVVWEFGTDVKQNKWIFNPKPMKVVGPALDPAKYP